MASRAEFRLTCVIFSLLPLGLSGASVSRTGCSCKRTSRFCQVLHATRLCNMPKACTGLQLTSGATRSSLKKVWCQIFSMSSQLVTMPCSMGYLRVKMPRLDCASSPTYESCHAESMARSKAGFRRSGDLACPGPPTPAHLLAHANHNASMAWSPHNAGEDGSRCIVPSKTTLHISLSHTRPRPI